MSRSPRNDREAHGELAKRAKVVPPRSILDKGFTYVPSTNTDIRETFKRVLKERRGEQ